LSQVNGRSDDGFALNIRIVNLINHFIKLFIVRDDLNINLEIFLT